MNRILFKDDLTGLDYGPTEPSPASACAGTDRGPRSGFTLSDVSSSSLAGGEIRIATEPAPFFNSGCRIGTLIKAAASWKNTPFFPNGNTKGENGGVSCQKLVEALYRETGCCDIQTPSVPMAHGNHGGPSLLVPFMDGLKNFKSVWPVEPGDMVAFRLGKVAKHCGVYLGSGRFIHAMEDLGVVISNMGDSTWSSRFAAAWRPYK